MPNVEKTSIEQTQPSGQPTQPTWPDSQLARHVLVVRDGVAWLASNPAMYAESAFHSDVYALAKWVREWGEKVLGVEVRDI